MQIISILVSIKSRGKNIIISYSVDNNDSINTIKK